MMMVTMVMMMFSASRLALLHLRVGVVVPLLSAGIDGRITSLCHSLGKNDE